MYHYTVVVPLYLYSAGSASEIGWYRQKQPAIAGCGVVLAAVIVRYFRLAHTGARYIYSAGISGWYTLVLYRDHFSHLRTRCAHL